MNNVVKMLLTLMIIGAVSGGVLSSLFKWAEPFIKENDRLKTEESIYKVQPGGKSYEKIEIKDLEAYKVFDENKEIIGYSIVDFGNGFVEKIKVMIGVDKDLENIKIVGMEVLYRNETPGLGTKIEEPPFKTRFDNLSAEPNVIMVKSVASKDNEISAITGATISSKAVVDIVNKAVGKFREARGDL